MNQPNSFDEMRRASRRINNGRMFAWFYGLGVPTALVLGALLHWYDGLVGEPSSLEMLIQGAIVFVVFSAIAAVIWHKAFEPAIQAEREAASQQLVAQHMTNNASDIQKISIDGISPDEAKLHAGWLQQCIPSRSLPSIGKRMKGLMLARWQEFSGSVQDGDEVWSFRSPPATWANGMGRSGYALRRNGVIVATFTTMMN